MEDSGRSFFGLDKTKLCRQLSFNQDGIQYSSIGRKLQPRLDSANKEEEGWQKIDPLKLVLGQVIGSGSDGVVHKGQYQGQTVAVKVLEKVRDLRLGSLDDRLREEVSAWKNLDHPNITKMIGATKCMDGCKKECELSETESSYCIVMEYVEGGNLMSYLLENQLEEKPPFKTIIRIALDIAKGLSYLHSKKIIHRDIKTENMLLGKKLEVKIADFGLAVFEPKDVLVRLRGSVGTPGYMAPESSYRCKSDVYSYGVCLWEIYCSQNSYQLHGEMKPPIPDKCPRSLRRLMERCMESDPKKRPEMKEVVLELQAIAAAESKGPGCFGFFN